MEEWENSEVKSETKANQVYACMTNMSCGLPKFLTWFICCQVEVKRMCSISIFHRVGSSKGWGAPGREVNPQKGHLLHLLLLECWGPPPWGHGVCVVMLECWWSRGLMYSCAVILLFGCLNLPPAFLAHASTCFGASVNCECLLALCTSLQWMDGLLVHSVLYFCQCNGILYSYMRWTIEYLRVHASF